MLGTGCRRFRDGWPAAGLVNLVVLCDQEAYTFHRSRLPQIMSSSGENNPQPTTLAELVVLGAALS